MNTKQKVEFDKNARRLQHVVIDSLQLICISNGCNKSTASLFLKLCGDCVKIAPVNYNQESSCIAPSCSNRTSSSVLNFCPDHQLKLLDQLGVKRVRKPKHEWESK